jgi:low affinity Fe/Cu permease
MIKQSSMYSVRSCLCQHPEKWKVSFSTGGDCAGAAYLCHTTHCAISMSQSLEKPPMPSQEKSMSKLFGDLANVVARAAGRPSAFVIAIAIVLLWGVAGPIFKYSDTWQLVINTGTTIVTFLMVFLIQNSQNRDSAAIQVKLDELVRVSEVKNLFVGIEHLTEDEIEELRTRCEARAKADGDRVVRRVDKAARDAADSAG